MPVRAAVPKMGTPGTNGLRLEFRQKIFGWDRFPVSKRWEKRCSSLFIVLKIVLERIREKTESEINDEQAGFRSGRGTRDQIINLRILMQKLNEHRQPLYMCFVDFTKAFDTISQEHLWVTKTEMAFTLSSC